MKCLFCDVELQQYTYPVRENVFSPKGWYACSNAACLSHVDLYKNHDDQITRFTFKMIINNHFFFIFSDLDEDTFIIFENDDDIEERILFKDKFQSYDKNVFTFINRILNLLSFD